MHILNIPPEIRLEIYSELLVQDDPIEISNRSLNGQELSGEPMKGSQYMQTDPTAYEEGA